MCALFRAGRYLSGLLLAGFLCAFAIRSQTVNLAVQWTDASSMEPFPVDRRICL